MSTAPQQDSTRRPRSLREEVTNLPNMLTLARVAMIPPVILLMLASSDGTDPAGDARTNFFAACIFGAAAITDWLDGFLARRLNIESVLGKLMDPMADKLIVLAVLVIAAQLGHIPGWFVVLLLSREVAISGLRSIASSEGLTIEVVSAGKWKTALQLCGLVGVIVHYTYPVNFVFTTVDVDFAALGFWLLALSMVFSLVSAGMYFGRFMKAATNKTGDAA